jgi:hypothetical protein
MKIFKPTSIIIAVGVLAVGAIFCEIGCNADDNRQLTPAEVKASRESAFKELDKSGMPEAAKKQLESRMGGPAYSNPDIAAAMEKAKAGGRKDTPGARQF